MNTTVDAIYEHGKLTLPQPLALPEKSHVRVTIESNDMDRSGVSPASAFAKWRGRGQLPTGKNADDYLHLTRDGNGN
ncbi:MAG: antitoxin family protein [Limisphaerales bacterium]